MLFIFSTDTCFWIACKINDLRWYEKIYEIKKRDLNKPLAIIVSDFDFLRENTYINEEQINFLKKYNRAFSVLLEAKTDLIDSNLANKDLYKKISFRIAHSEVQKKLIKKYWSLFLTSANLSGEKEIYKISEINDIFWNIPEIEIFWEDIDDKNPPSDIFEFIWETNEIKYLRKN